MHRLAPKVLHLEPDDLFALATQALFFQFLSVVGETKLIRYAINARIGQITPNSRLRGLAYPAEINAELPR
jgi:hypothetical protein